MKRAARLCLFVIAFLFGYAFAAAALAEDQLPVNPAVTPENIAKTVCVPNWDKPVRPSVSVTNRIKFSKMDALKIPRVKAHDIELDHVISLVLGGAPQDPRNLRLQYWYGDVVKTPADADSADTQAHVKDVLEVRLHKLVCAGKLDLREAQRCIFEDWRACALKHPAK